MIPKLKEWGEAWLERNPDWKPFVAKVQTFTLPGFESIPVWDVMNFFIREIKRDTLPMRAQAISYSFFIAIFPAIIFLFSLIPYIPLEGFQADLMSTIAEIAPDPSVFKFIEDSIDDIIGKQRGGLLSIGFFLSLFFTTNGVIALMDSFDKTYSIYANRNFLTKRVVAFKITLLLFTMFMCAVLLIIAGRDLLNLLMDWLNIQSSLTAIAINLLRYLIILLLFFYSISMIYYYGPATKRKWRFISLGSTVATILSLILSVGFSYYVSNFGQFNKFYGSITAIILLLIWIYLISFALLIGFELNASIYYNKSLKIRRDRASGL